MFCNSKDLCISSIYIHRPVLKEYTIRNKNRISPESLWGIFNTFCSEKDEEQGSEDDDDDSSEGEDVEEIFGGARKDAQKSNYEKRQERVCRKKNIALQSESCSIQPQ